MNSTDAFAASRYMLSPVASARRAETLNQNYEYDGVIKERERTEKIP
jgi:hypothetical protein